MAVHTGIPKGTRDFLPVEMIRRNRIFDTIRNVFSLFGYQPIETPAMEKLVTLTGKYGEEGDRLIFKILNSGDFLAGIDLTEENQTAQKLGSKIAEKALRYDLTVPFARFIVQHQSEIGLPFRRYQIQPVWRADRPQKGRYREFYQCDADIIGTRSLLCEAELVRIMDEVFAGLGIRVAICFNNRKILTGIAETIGYAEKFTEFTVAIDKLEKIGAESVSRELREKGFSGSAVEKILEITDLKGPTSEKILFLKNLLAASEAGIEGIRETESMLNYMKQSDHRSEVVLNPALARGLDYYTGAIFEVKALDIDYGSICGGGRYDDLTGIMGLPGVSGVGVSFGADRIYDVMNHLGMFADEFATTIQVLFVNFGGEEELYGLHIADHLRKSGISAEVFPEAAKLKKQFSYADARKIPYVAITGSDEVKAGVVSLKNMKTGEQQKLTKEQLISYLSEN